MFLHVVFVCSQSCFLSVCCGEPLESHSDWNYTQRWVPSPSRPVGCAEPPTSSHMTWHLPSLSPLHTCPTPHWAETWCTCWTVSQKSGPYETLGFLKSACLASSAVCILLLTRAYSISTSSSGRLLLSPGLDLHADFVPLMTKRRKRGMTHPCSFLFLPLLRVSSGKKKRKKKLQSKGFKKDYSPWKKSDFFYYFAYAAGLSFISGT